MADPREDRELVVLQINQEDFAALADGATIAYVCLGSVIQQNPVIKLKLADDGDSETDRTVGQPLSVFSDDDEADADADADDEVDDADADADGSAADKDADKDADADPDIDL